MMIEEYKETVLHELEKAVDEYEVEQIINRSVEQFPENDLFRYLVIIYLHILQSELKKLSEQNIDSPRKRNIRHGLNYLRQMNANREKVE
ncbi:MAG: hypothetical protein Q8941_05685 [Bacteroidota bacterium]|nr:hypothetical protein [Bacteroidota bacterium]